MNKRLCAFVLIISILFSVPAGAAPENRDNTPAKSWEEIRQEKTIVYDQDQIIHTDTEEEILEKKNNIKAQMKENEDIFIERQQQAVNEGHEIQSPVMPLLGEDAYWDCPYSNIVGGYTLINDNERLSINVDPYTNLNDIVTEASDKVNAACSYDHRPQGVFRYQDAPYSYPMKTATTQIGEPAWSMVSVTGYSMPSSHFEEMDPGDFYAYKAGRTKIIFRYDVCEMYVYWDPDTGESLTDYFNYNVYMPMDVIIGDATKDALYAPWTAGGELQDWFFTWCKEVLGTSTLWPTLESYVQVDGCDFDLDLLDIPNISLGTPENYPNSHGGAKQLPPIMENLISQYLTIDLSYNDLTGIIPPEVGQIGFGVGNINLSHNKLCGNIPQFTSGGELNVDVSYNQLTGIYHDANEFDALSIDANFISAMQIDYHIPDALKNGYTSSEKQYHLVLTSPGAAIEILPDMTLTAAYARGLTQIELEGTVQDPGVASELMFELVPGTGFYDYFDGMPETGYTPKQSGSTSIGLGFTSNNTGAVIEPGDTTYLSGVMVTNILGDAPGTLRKSVAEGESFSVVVSGKNLQNIINKTFAVTYSASDLELLDAYTQTPLPDLAVGAVPGSNMTITEIIPGSLKFQLAPEMGSFTYWGGVATILKFRAKRTIATAVTLA